MPQFFPNSGSEFIADTVVTELVASKLRLFKTGLTPSIATTRAQLLAEEADYTGYTAGGQALAAWFDPLLNPLGGYSTDSPKVQFAPVAPFTVGNTIAGFWVETAGGTVVSIGTFLEPIPMSQAGNGFPISVSLIFPN